MTLCQKPILRFLLLPIMTLSNTVSSHKAYHVSFLNLNVKPVERRKTAETHGKTGTRKQTHAASSEVTTRVLRGSSPMGRYTIMSRTSREYSR